MSSIDLVLCYKNEKPRIFTIQDLTSKLTILELKAKIHEFIACYIDNADNSEIYSSLIDQEFAEFQKNDEETFLNRYNLQAKYSISRTEIDAENNLLKALKNKFYEEGMILQIYEKKEIENESKNTIEKINPKFKIH